MTNKRRVAFSSNRERDRMIREIKKYAFAQVDYGSSRLQLHRLAQLVLREQLSGQDERDEVRHQAHMLIAAADPDDPDVPENWERYRDLWPHVEPSGAVECVHREVREMVLNLTRYLYVQGSYDAGQAFAEMALRHWEQTFGADDQATLVLVRHLATIDESSVLVRFPDRSQIGDKGYVGKRMITLIRKPEYRDFLDWEKEFNTQVNKIRYMIEQVIANFKTWRTPPWTDTVRLSAPRILKLSWDVCSPSAVSAAPTRYT